MDNYDDFESLYYVDNVQKLFNIFIYDYNAGKLFNVLCSKLWKSL